MAESVDFSEVVVVTVKCEQCNKVLAEQRMTLSAWVSMCQRHEDVGKDDCNLSTRTRWVDECDKCYKEEFGGSGETD